MSVNSSHIAWFISLQTERGLTHSGMNLSVTDCSVTNFMMGSVIADVELNVTQPAMANSTENQVHSENLRKMFNLTAAQMVAPNLTVVVDAVDVAGKSFLDFLIQLNFRLLAILVGYAMSSTMCTWLYFA